MTVQRIETGIPDCEALGPSYALFSVWVERYEDKWLYFHYITSRVRNKSNT